MKSYHHPQKLRVKTKRLNRSLGGNIAIFIVIALMSAFMLLPMVYTVSTAFKPISEIYVFPPHFFPHSPTLENFVQISLLFEDFWIPMSRYVFNTVFICTVVTVGHLVLSSLAAYALARLNFTGRKLISDIVRLSLLFTTALMLIPQYIVMSKLHMINTYWAYILPQVQSALGLYLLQNFMLQIPEAMLEAARVDGASEFQVYSRIVMPNIKPAWLTVMIFAFQTIWNSSGATISTTLIYDEKIKMISSLLSQVVAGGTARSGVGSVMGLILMIPPLVLFICCQNQVIETMSTSGMKD